MPDSGSAPNKQFTRSVAGYTGSDAIQQGDAAGRTILSADLDEQANDLVDGLNNRVMRDGGNQPTADLPMGGFRHTGVGNASARTSYASAAQIQDGSLTHATDSGTNTRTATLSPAVTAYVSGMMVALKAASANTGSATINLNSVGAGTVKKGKTGASNLDAGDIGAGKMGLYIHDGTNWQMLNAPEFPSGTKMLFQQTSAPTGWTKETGSGDNSAVRIVTGSVGTGGTVDFSTAFASQTPSGTVGATTLTENQIPSHRHFIVDNAAGSDATDPSNSNQISYRNTSSPGGSSGNNYFLTGTANDADVGRTSATGGGASHDHTFTGNAINLAVKRTDVIVATKD